MVFKGVGLLGLIFGFAGQKRPGLWFRVFGVFRVFWVFWGVCGVQGAQCGVLGVGCWV